MTTFPVSAMTTSARPTTYDNDFYAWTQQQAELLRQERFADVDLENVIEEIESLGKRDFLSFTSAIFRLTQHLLKWQYQPEKRTASWRATIREQRRRIRRMVEQSPSLESERRLAEALFKGYEDGRDAAADETGLPLVTFPEECPYTWEQLTDKHWLPE
jgi:hypothetical protein